MKTVLRLVLTHHWFEETAFGRKKIEYRQGNPETLKTVIFSRGYCYHTLERQVVKIDIGPCPIPGWTGDFYRIHFI
jgi:hypothetical protein